MRKFLYIFLLTAIILCALIFAGLTPSLRTSAPDSVEVITFEKETALQVNLVHLSEDEEAITIAPFDVSLKCDRQAKRVTLIPTGEEIPFSQANGEITFKSRELRIFDMYEIEL